MAVFQIVKALIGKEDINWGDSGSTFTRQTHTGGATEMTYVDAECIPATTLGGYIGDHLHEQDTDTETDNTTWTINTNLILSSTGLTAARTFTFPDTGNQELVGATDLASTSNGLGGSTVGVEDTGGYFDGNDLEAVTQELGLDVSTLQTSTINRGMKNGLKLAYSSATAITITGGMWAHLGTSNQHVYCASQLTFTCGPAGSNSGSANLGASEIHYIYIDDSAVVAAGIAVLSNTEILNSTTAPTWSHAKVGWYNGSDRCIGAVLTNGSSQILSFYITSNGFYRYDEPITELASGAAATSSTAIDLSSSMPRFSTRARVRVTNVTAGTSLYFDRKSSAVTSEAYTMDTANRLYTVEAPTNATQSTYYFASAGNTITIDLVGYYIDEL